MVNEFAPLNTKEITPAYRRYMRQVLILKALRSHRDRERTVLTMLGTKPDVTFSDVISTCKERLDYAQEMDISKYEDCIEKGKVFSVFSMLYK